MDLKDIKAIIDLMKKNDLSVFEMEKDGFRLKLCKGLGDQPIMMSSTAPAAANGPTGAAAASAGTESASTKEITDRRAESATNNHRDEKQYRTQHRSCFGANCRAALQNH